MMSTFVGFLILLVVVGLPLWVLWRPMKEVRDRMRAGRGPVEAIWDIGVSSLFGPLIGVATLAVILMCALPSMFFVLKESAGKTPVGDIVIEVFTHPENLPKIIKDYGNRALGEEANPWQPIQPQTQSQSQPVQPALAQSQQSVAPQAQPQQPAQVQPQSPPAQPQQQAQPQAQPELFFTNKEVALCWWRMFLSKKSSWSRLGRGLMPAGSSWVLKNHDVMPLWMQSNSHEQWELCSVEYGWCVGISGKEADSFNGKKEGMFYGEGIFFPQECVPTPDPTPTPVPTLNPTPTLTP